MIMADMFYCISKYVIPLRLPVLFCFFCLLTNICFMIMEFLFLFFIHLFHFDEVLLLLHKSKSAQCGQVIKETASYVL